jgi:hypothetical protein
MRSSFAHRWAPHWYFTAQPFDYPEKMIESYCFDRYIRSPIVFRKVGLETRLEGPHSA